MLAAGCVEPADVEPITLLPDDTEAPLVHIAAPADGDRVRDRVVVRVDVTEDHLRYVAVWVDRRWVGSLAEPPFEFALDELTDGAHAITAMAEDDASNVTLDSLTIWAYPHDRPSSGTGSDTRESPVITGGCSTTSSGPPLTMLLVAVLARRIRRA